jgi:hypothetical protein
MTLNGALRLFAAWRQWLSRRSALTPDNERIPVPTAATSRQSVTAKAVRPAAPPGSTVRAAKLLTSPGSVVRAAVNGQVAVSGADSVRPAMTAVRQYASPVRPAMMSAGTVRAARLPTTPGIVSRAAAVGGQDAPDSAEPVRMATRDRPAAAAYPAAVRPNVAVSEVDYDEILRRLERRIGDEAARGAEGAR